MIELADECIIPSKFRTNDFLVGFQDINDLYGVPNHKELNPTIFNVVTFPFLFGLMFGDLFHGSILLVFALLVINVQQFKETPVYKYRFFLLLLSIGSVFCGLMYNEFASLAFPFNHLGISADILDANNSLTITNSLKMKMSIIFGITHMIIGLVLKILNDVNQKDKVTLWLESVP